MSSFSSHYASLAACPATLSLYSFILEKKRPDLVRKMVAIDVGGAIEFKPLQLLCIMSYHFWLIIAFVVGGPIGDAMAQSFAWLVGAPFRSNVAKASVCYPYYHWWKQKLCRGPKVGAMVPEVPLLFLYGTSGPKAAVVSYQVFRLLVQVVCIFFVFLRRRSKLTPPASLRARTWDSNVLWLMMYCCQESAVHRFELIDTVDTVVHSRSFFGLGLFAVMIRGGCCLLLWKISRGQEPNPHCMLVHSAPSSSSRKKGKEPSDPYPKVDLDNHSLV